MFANILIISSENRGFCFCLCEYFADLVTVYCCNKCIQYFALFCVLLDCTQISIILLKIQNSGCELYYRYNGVTYFIGFNQII